MIIKTKVILYTNWTDIEKRISERMEKYLIIKKDYIMKLKNISYILIGLGMIVLFASVGLILETKFSKYKNPAIEQFYQDCRY